jgi:small subunit ribosomal protein S18
VLPAPEASIRNSSENSEHGTARKNKKEQEKEIMAEETFTPRAEGGAPSGGHEPRQGGGERHSGPRPDGPRGPRPDGPRGPGGSGGPGGRKFFRRKKVCKFCVEKIDAIQYRDVRLLQGFVAERGKIVPRRLTGVCTTHQRRLTTAIKQARNIALLPFAARF